MESDEKSAAAIVFLLTVKKKEKERQRSVYGQNLGCGGELI